MKRLVVIVSGSRRLRPEPHAEAIRAYLKEIRAGRPFTVHCVLLHGAQTGADMIADVEGRQLGFDPWGIPYFGELGNYGGPKRNECLIEVGIALCKSGQYDIAMGAFPDEESRGTWHAVRYAENKGITATVRKQ